MNTNSKREQLQIRIGVISEIYANAKESFNYCKYFYQPIDKTEMRLANSDIHLQFIRHSLWRQTITELSKLFCKRDNDKFNIKRFLDSLRFDGYYGDLNFPLRKIEHWEQQIKAQNSVISDIMILRDKVYDHTDPKKEEFEKIIVSLRNIQCLIDIISDIIIEVYGCMLDGHFDSSLPSDNQDICILSDIVAQRNS